MHFVTENDRTAVWEIIDSGWDSISTSIDGAQSGKPARRKRKSEGAVEGPSKAPSRKKRVAKA